MRTVPTGPAARRRRLAAALAVLAITPAGPAAAAPPIARAEVAARAPTPSQTVQAGEATVTGRTVIDDGHIDVGPRFVDGQWTIQLRDDSRRPPVWRNLPDVVLHATDSARLTVPGNPAFTFLGRPGARVWLLPQVQQAGVLWPGWNSQDPLVATTISREVTWTLHGVTGPGHFVLFLTGEFGAPDIVFDSAERLPQQTGVDVNTHVHGNWAFAAPGTYLLDIELSGSTVQGEDVSDRRFLRVFAGPGDPSAAFAVGAETPPTAIRTGGPTTSAAGGTSGQSATTGETSADASPLPWVLAGAVALGLLLGAVGLLRGRRGLAAGPPDRTDTE